MKRKIIILISVPLLIALIAVFIILIQPKETVINETMRLYRIESVSLDDYSDDTGCEEFADKYIDAEVELRILQGVGSYNVNGTIDIGQKEYYVFGDSSVNVHSDTPGLLATAKGSSHYDLNPFRITDDMKYVMLILSGDLEGVWTSASTLGDYKREIESLYP